MTEATLAALQERIAALEARDEISNLVARYMELCDVLDAGTPMDELGHLFAKDAIWAGKGSKYGEAFGGHKGREAIVAFINDYREPVPHFEKNIHFLTSESVVVDGNDAKGTWVMLQTPTFAQGGAFLMAARLNLEFQVEDGRWRISRFETENLLSRFVSQEWSDTVPLPVPTDVDDK